MALHMEGKMIGAGETTVANLTPERLGARVFAIVSCEFVRSREPPVTTFPRALVGLLTCN